jgi:SAM-dependent methyltransferase
MKFASGKGSIFKGAGTASVQSRHSSGLDQFCGLLQHSEPQSILDMSGASQANISFVTSLGHRISSDDLLGTMQECFGDDFLDAQQNPENASCFLSQSLTFADQSFDGVLVWDALQFLTTPLLEGTVANLLRILRPGGAMLLFFHADTRTPQVPTYNYRISDRKSIQQIPRGGTQRSQFFPNRTIEQLFDRASSLKFFLSRDSLREVIVRR